jgi:hypothetical protein
MIEGAIWHSAQIATAKSNPASASAETVARETIVLPKITDLGMQPPTPPAQPADATIISPPASPSQPPVAPTMIGSAPSMPPATPPTEPAPPYSAGDYSGSSLPPASAVPPPAAKSGSNIWKILGIIVGIVVVLCVALSIGAYLVIRRAGTIAENTLATANASLSDGTFATVGVGFQTAVSGSDLDNALATIEAGATTAEPAATRTPKPDSGTASGSTLYSDNFDDEQSSDFTAETNESSVYKFADGVYQITVTKPKLLSWATMNGDYGDAAISVDASIDGPPASAAGLIFHYQDDKNFYIYSVDGEGRYELDVYKNDEPITLIDWTESSAIKPAGEINTLRVETSGDTIRLYANDKLLDEVSDSTIPNGKAALVVNTFDEPNVTVSFDNLVVRSVN